MAGCDRNDAAHVLLHPGDEVVAVLVLLQTTESHLGAGNVLLGVLQVLEQGLISPGDTLVDVGSGVRVSVCLTGLTAKDTEQVGTNFVWSTTLEGVALSTTGLEETGSLLNVT